MEEHGYPTGYMRTYQQGHLLPFHGTIEPPKAVIIQTFALS
jgi:hypothetical protein